MAKTKVELTKENLNRILEYRDGDLYWKDKPTPQSKCKIGSKASKFHCDSYGESVLSISLAAQNYSVSRLVYIMVHGVVPEVVVHVDRNKLNNRIENLRATTRALASTEQVTKNKSGYRNVYPNPGAKIKSRICKKWLGKARIDGKLRSVGAFDDPHEAYLAVLKMEEEHGRSQL